MFCVHVKACKLAAWGQDLFVHVWFSWPFRHSDREQILNMNSQRDGSEELVRSEELAWTQVKLLTELRVKPLEGDFDDQAKVGTREEMTGASGSRWWRFVLQGEPCDWETWSKAFGMVLQNVTNAANETWWVVPFPKERHVYNQIGTFFLD